MINPTQSTMRNDDWIDDDDIPDPEPPKELPGWSILVRPMRTRKKTKGGILLADSVQDDIDLLSTCGKVLAVGPLAYSRDDMLIPHYALSDDEQTTLQLWKHEGDIWWYRKPWCKVGDIVAFAKFSGVKYFYRGVRCLLLNDDMVRMVLHDKNELDPLFNLTKGA